MNNVQGPIREMIESAGVDGFLMGPVAPYGINKQQFVQLLMQMQALKKQSAMSGMAALSSNWSAGELNCK